MTAPTKVCSNANCHLSGEPQPLSNFGRNDSTASGLSYVCKACACAYQTQWKKDHPESARKWRRAYIERNKARNRARRGESAPPVDTTHPDE